MSNSKTAVLSYSDTDIFKARHHWLLYIGLSVATYTEEERQSQIISFFVQQRWFQSVTWMSTEHL